MKTIAKRVEDFVASLDRDERNFITASVTNILLLMKVAVEIWDTCPESVDGTRYYVFNDGSRLQVGNPRQEVYPLDATEDNRPPEWWYTEPHWLRLK